MDKSKVLFVCVHKSACSQIAEAYLRQMVGERVEVESAGFELFKQGKIIQVRHHRLRGFPLGTVLPFPWSDQPPASALPPIPPS